MDSPSPSLSAAPTNSPPDASLTVSGRPRRSATAKATPAKQKSSPPTTSRTTKPKPTIPITRTNVQGPYNPKTKQHGNITLTLNPSNTLTRTDSIISSDGSQPPAISPPLHTQRIDDVEARLDELEPDLDVLQTGVETLQSSLEAFQDAASAQITSLAADVRKLNRATTALGNPPALADLQTLNAKVDTLTDRFDSVAVMVDSVVQESQLHSLLSLVHSLAEHVTANGQVNNPMQQTPLPTTPVTPTPTQRTKRTRSPSSAAATPPPKSLKCPPTDVCIANVPWSSPPDYESDKTLFLQLAGHIVADNPELGPLIPRVAVCIWGRNNDRIRCIRLVNRVAADTFLEYFKSMAAEHYPNTEAVAYPASRHDFYVSQGHPTPALLNTLSSHTSSPSPAVHTPEQNTPASSVGTPSPTPTAESSVESLPTILAELASMRRSLAAKQREMTGDGY